MRRLAHRFSLCFSFGLGLIACADAGGEPPTEAADSAERPEPGTDDGAGAEPESAGQVADDTQTTGANASGDALSFRRDGEVVDFAGANNASYYQKNFGNYRLVAVMNDVLGDKYVAIDITGSNGAELSPGSYDCSKPLDELRGAKAKLTFRSGEQTWQQAAGKPCSIQLASIGAVGGRLTGSFSATLASKAGAAPDLVISEGVFDVKRKEF